MHSFRELNIQPTAKGFEGEKIKMDRVLNKEIIVEQHKIEKSKYEEKGNGKCLYLQVVIEGKKRVVFTGSANLMDMIQKVPGDKFPFKTVIEKDENGRLSFT
jgi:hypothetical protein